MQDEMWKMSNASIHVNELQMAEIRNQNQNGNDRTSDVCLGNTTVYLLYSILQCSTSTVTTHKNKAKNDLLHVSFEQEKASRRHERLEIRPVKRSLGHGR